MDKKILNLDDVEWKLFLNDLVKVVNSDTFIERFNHIYTNMICSIEVNDNFFTMRFDDIIVLKMPVVLRDEIIKSLFYFQILKPEGCLKTLDGVTFNLI